MPGNATATVLSAPNRVVHHFERCSSVITDHAAVPGNLTTSRTQAAASNTIAAAFRSGSVGSNVRRLIPSGSL